MSKQDRQGVRTAADIERKYDLGKLNTFRGDSQKQDIVVNELTQKVDQFIATTNGNLATINIDIAYLKENISGMTAEQIIATINNALAEAKASGEFKGDPFTYEDFTPEQLASLRGVIEDTTYPGCYYRNQNDVIEWVNPPMVFDVEYRTTERYKGNPVYTKLINFGNLPNKTVTSVNVGKNYNIVSIEGETFNGNSSVPLSVLYLINSVYYNKSDGELSINATGDASAWSAEIVLKYTK